MEDNNRLSSKSFSFEKYNSRRRSAMKIISLPRIVIDAHLHGRGMLQHHKTTIKQVLREANSSGIGISFFMPNTYPRLDDLQPLDFYLYNISLAVKKLNIPNRQYVFFEFNGKNLHRCKQAWRRKNVIGFKVYPEAWTNYGELVELLRFSRKHDLVVDFHCNSLSLQKIQGDSEETEMMQVFEVITLARLVPGVKITICHVSCRKSVELILRAQDEGMQIAIELTPQHLWFHNGSWRKFGVPQWFYCQNLIRSQENRDYLRWFVTQGNQLVFISSDSACHTQAEKLEMRLPGIPSNQELLAVAASLTEYGLPENQIPKLTSFNAADHYGVDVPEETVAWEFEKRIDDAVYNNGVVFNPWNGEKLLFPVRRAG
jgi:dihydroorotase-like cyclic amidohydrolase